jgi:hypothetical protein
MKHVLPSIYSVDEVGEDGAEEVLPVFLRRCAPA